MIRPPSFTPTAPPARGAPLGPAELPDSALMAWGFALNSTLKNDWFLDMLSPIGDN
jgi:hypothetical protein